MNEKLQNLQTRLNEVKEEIKTEFQSVFKEQTNELFEKYTWLKEISWTQYTPYFNDGDTCEFGVNEACVNGVESWSEDSFYESYSSIIMNDDGIEELIEKLKSDDALKAEFKEVLKVANELNSFLQKNDEVAIMMFGDHVKVSIQADGVYTEEYDHD